MPAGKPAHGTVPEAKVTKQVTETSDPVTDVKNELAAASAQEAEAKPSESKPDFEEADLATFEESKKIPYTRFKEINEAKKGLERRLSELERSREQDIRRAIEDAEIRIMNRVKQEQETASSETEFDPSQREIRELKAEIRRLNGEFSSLRTQTSESVLQNQLDGLKKKYSEMDELAVLGWKKSRPDADLEDLAEHSHRQNVERTEKALREILEAKKKKSHQVVPTLSTGGIRLKDSEKPKTLKEANTLLRRMIRGS